MKRGFAIMVMTFLLVIPVVAFETELTVLESVTTRYVESTNSVNFPEKDVALAHTFTDIALALSFEEAVRLVPQVSAPQMIASKQATNRQGTILCAKTYWYPLIFDLQRGPSARWQRDPGFHQLLFRFAISTRGSPHTHR